MGEVEVSKAEEIAYAKTLKWKEHSILRNLIAGVEGEQQ